jgi:hypothetical protein
MRLAPAQLRDDVGVEQKRAASGEYDGRPATALATRRHRDIGAWFGREQELLQGGAGGFQAAPMANRHQDRGLYATLGDHLRALLQAGLQHFAEPRFGVLYLPMRHWGFLVAEG